MTFPPERLRRRHIVAALIATIALAVALTPLLIGGAIQHAARARGWNATFDGPHLTMGLGARLLRLRLVRESSTDTLLFADSLEIRPSLWRLLTLRFAPSEVRLAHVRVHVRGGDGESDSLDDDEPASRDARPDRSARFRALADQITRTLLLPARSLPRLDVRDVLMTRSAGSDDTLSVRLERLTLEPENGGARCTAAGWAANGGASNGQGPGDDAIPFSGELRYDRLDRLTGLARIEIPDLHSSRRWPMELAVDGIVRQDRRHGRLELREPTTLRLGRIVMRVEGQLERRGPALHLDLASDSLSDARLKTSLPPPVLGPLEDVGARGTWDYRLGFQLDLDRPDSVSFDADVIPHGLVLDPARTRLPLLELDQPFVATIHLPHGKLVTRELSGANPHFRTLGAIDSILAHAVVTNEDGGFFRHRGFNPEAVKSSIAENIRAGAYRRGAGTITMQVARNLWLGHDRTLSRKAQEVILAWVLEHLTGVSKRRLLEIYLNIIEWGPDVHGADEASRYFFDQDAGRLTVDEALFLTTVIPAPNKWRWRFEKDGTLRPFEREQMHFIGRAMIAKGWLSADALPPVDQLRVELRGPARDVLLPP